MVSYATNELVSSSKFVRNFGKYLSELKKQTFSKIAILKNNKIEAVVILKDEYENILEKLEYFEDLALEKELNDRISQPYKTISHQEMLKKFNV